MTKSTRKHIYSIEKPFKDKFRKFWWVMEDKSRVICEVYVLKEALLIYEILAKSQPLPKCTSESGRHYWICPSSNNTYCSFCGIIRPTLDNQMESTS